MPDRGDASKSPPFTSMVLAARRIAERGREAAAVDAADAAEDAAGAEPAAELVPPGGAAIEKR